MDKNYDFFQPDHTMILRYAKFLFDRYGEEKFPNNKFFLNERMMKEAGI